MGYKKGDKFIIEIGDVISNRDGSTFYKMKGFNTLIFDDYGLDKLEKKKEEAHDFKIGQVVFISEENSFGIIIAYHDWLCVVWNEDMEIAYYNPEDLICVDLDDDGVLNDLHNMLIKYRNDSIFNAKKTN